MTRARSYKRDTRGRFARTNSKAPKRIANRVGGVTYETKKKVYPLTITTSGTGSIRIYPKPMRVLETKAYKGKALLGQTNTRVRRKSATVEQIHVDQAHRGKGIAKEMLRHQEKALRGKPLGSSSYRSADGERLARKMQGDKVSRRVTNANTASITKNIEDSWADQKQWHVEDRAKRRRK